MGQGVFNKFENPGMETAYIISAHIYLTITNHMMTLTNSQESWKI